MKNPNEKKSVVKSVKLSPNQYDVIMKRAEAKGMNFSEYMVDCAVRGEQGLSPQIAVKIQEIENFALDLVDRLPCHYERERERVIARIHELDELMHPESPFENQGHIFHDIDMITEGAESIWESLKSSVTQTKT